VVAVCRIWCLVFKLSVQCGVEGCCFRFAGCFTAAPTQVMKVLVGPSQVMNLLVGPSQVMKLLVGPSQVMNLLVGPSQVMKAAVLVPALNLFRTPTS
jgi:hypothetical protein